MSDFENNLKLNYEALRKDLDILLTSTIPTQKNLIKTYLWFNSIILGVLATKVLPINICNYYLPIFIVIVFACSFASILFCLVALTGGHNKGFGHIELDAMHQIKGGHKHAQGIIKLTEATKQSFIKNKDIITKRAALIRKALFTTITAFIFMSILMFIINIKL